MSNPGGINLNISPYYDDYDEDKKFARILFRPSYAVQARELTQSQSIQQKQIERFANFFFKQGSIIEGCEQTLDLNLPYVKVQPTYADLLTPATQTVAVANFTEQEIVGSQTGIRAYVGITSDLTSTDPKTFFINYLSNGAIKIKISDSNFPTGNFNVGNKVEFFTASGAGSVTVAGTLVAWDVDPITSATATDNQYIWVNDLTGDFSLIPNSGTPVIRFTYSSGATQEIEYDPASLSTQVIVNGNQPLPSRVITVVDASNVVVGSPVTGTGIPAGAYITAFQTTPTHTITLSVETEVGGVADTAPITVYTSDLRESSTFNDNELLFTSNYSSRFYAISETENATQYVVNAGTANELIYNKGSKATLGDGILYIADHFIKVDSQTILLDKYSNNPSYKVGVVPVKTFIDAVDDTTVLDNAQGYNNFQAPGADRLRIDVTWTKIGYNEVSTETEFVSMLEVEDGIIKKRKELAVEGKLEEAIARRTDEESGSYTLSDPKIAIREHLNTGTNNGRYSLSEGGDSDLLLAEADPFTAYVKGYRNEIIARTGITLRKGLDVEEVEQVKTQIVLGSYLPVNELIGFWDFETNAEVQLYDTAQTVITSKTFDGDSFAATGTQIGTARIKTIEYYSGEPGLGSAVYNLYLYDINITSSTFQNVRSIVQDKTGAPDCVADVVLDSFGDAILREPRFNRLVFDLPYTNIKSIRNAAGEIESSFRFRREFTINLSGGSGTVGSDDNSETFIGNGVLSDLQKRTNYMLIPRTTVLTNSAIETAVTTVIGDATVTGGVAFLTKFAAGDFVSIDGNIYKISSITDDNNLELDETASSNFTGDIYKAFPAGLPIRTVGLGSNGERSLTASPTSIQINLQENVQLNSANFVATMDRSNAREIRKDIVRDREVIIEPTANGPGGVAHPSGEVGPYSLGHSDVFQIKAIYDSGNQANAATTSDIDVTDLYSFDNGQRDNSYESASITPKIGTLPIGNLLVVFDYFTHDTTQGVGYYSVDSYPVDDSVTNTGSTIYTTDISSYTSSVGQVFDLRSSLDFRPSKINVANQQTNPSAQTTFDTPGTGGGLHIPASNSDFDADLVFYKGRKAKLYMNNKGELGITNGSPGFPVPSEAPSVPDTITLAEITVPAYPSLPKNVIINPIHNRRYTMKDIGKLESRVENIEFYTALNLLERESRDKSITDADGIDRFKNGILADPFTGHSVADVSLADYNASINRKQKYLTSYHDSGKSVQFKINEFTSTGYTKTKGNKLFLNYSQAEFIVQPYASSSINLAQQLTYSWVGDLRVYPATDNWIDVNRNPDLDLVIDPTGLSDNWKILSDAWNSEIFPAERHWIGEATKIISYDNDSASVVRTAKTKTWDVQIENANIDSAQKSINPILERLSDASISHGFRERDFVFEATGLKDGTSFYAFLDGIDVTANCKQIKLEGSTTIDELFLLYDNDGILGTDNTKYTQLFNGSLRTSKNKIYGILRIPSGYKVGQREFKLTDDSQNRDTLATSIARIPISATGISINRGTTFINTRPSFIAFDNASYVQTVSRVASTSASYSTNNFKRFDPIAQSFYVDESTYPNGVFVTSVDLYFKTKSTADNFGVTVEIRELDNGFPTRKIIGNESSRVENDAIATSTDSTSATNFEFPSPIYLLPGNEYCFSIKPDGNTDEYEIWTASLGEIDITDSLVNLKIDKQPAAGVLFTPSNELQWSVRQNQDIKFKLNIAEFDTSTSAIAYFDNLATPLSTYSVITPVIENLNVAGTNISYALSLTDISDQTTTYIDINNLERSTYASLYKVSTAGTLKSRLTMSTTDKHLSPYIDLDRIHANIEKISIGSDLQTELTGDVTITQDTNTVTGNSTSFNTEVIAGQYIKVGQEIKQVSVVNSATELLTVTNFRTGYTNEAIYKNPEEAPIGTYSTQSRYISRRVVLNDGFEGGDLNVFLDISRPAGSDVKVYYKIINESDPDLFDFKLYEPMELVGVPTITDNTNAYTEEKYVIPSEKLTGGSQILYGTVTTNGTTAVTGTDTRFSEELRIGDIVAIGPDRITGVVETVTDNGSITLESNFTQNLNGVSIYKVLNDTVEYTTPDGRTYTGFKSFAIKVAFISSNDAVSPRVKNLRAIALA